MISTYILRRIKNHWLANSSNSSTMLEPYSEKLTLAWRLSMACPKLHFLGSWNSRTSLLRVAYRGYSVPYVRCHSNGFRCVSRIRLTLNRTKCGLYKRRSYFFIRRGAFTTGQSATTQLSDVAEPSEMKSRITADVQLDTVSPLTLGFHRCWYVEEVEDRMAEKEQESQRQVHD